MRTWLFILALAIPALGAAIEEGTYRTAGPTRFVEGKLHFKRWGNKFKLTALLEQGKHAFPVEAFVRGHGGVESGTITVKYGNGTGCRHRFGLKITQDDDQLWIEENIPARLPYNPHGACLAAGPYQWKHHEEAYVRVP
jgi:hypothetical protein